MAFPAVYNFNYYRGDTYTMEITAKDITGADIQLEGVYNRCYINVASKRGGVAEDAVAKIIANLDGAKIIFQIPMEEGKTWESIGTYVYDVELQKTHNVTDPETQEVTTIVDEVYTVVTGSITVTDDVYGGA